MNRFCLSYFSRPKVELYFGNRDTNTLFRYTTAKVGDFSYYLEDIQ